MLEHPEIGWIQRTGYPSWMQEGREMEHRESMERITARLLRKLEKAVEELDLDIVAVSEKTKTEDGERVEKFQLARAGGVVDRTGLRQITGALKDLSELETLDLDTREQEARIAKLCREAGLEGDNAETGVIILPATKEETEG